MPAYFLRSIRFSYDLKPYTAATFYTELPTGLAYMIPKAEATNVIFGDVVNK